MQAVELAQAISSVRLEGYRRNRMAAPEAEVLGLYGWNVALCESLYPALHCVELALRNGIHTAAHEQFGREDWYDDPRVITGASELEMLGAARARLVQVQKPIEPGRIVAELHFGFWVGEGVRTFV